MSNLAEIDDNIDRVKNPLTVLGLKLQELERRRDAKETEETDALIREALYDYGRVAGTVNELLAVTRKLLMMKEEKQ